MRLEYFRCHNVGPFADFELDLSKVNGPLVALTAPNGTGKTFTLEAAILGAAYRKMATQGTLIGRATARDSFIEARLVNGKRWTIRHELDAVSRKGESVVLDESGEPAFKGTSVKAFDKWSERTLPPEDIVCSTIFAVQGSSGFLGLGSAERISVILQAVGVARLEKMAELARSRVKVANEELRALGVRIEDARASAPSVEAVEAELASARDRVEVAAAAVAKAQSELDVARELARDSALAQQRYKEQKAARDALVKRRDDTKAELGRAELDLSNADVPRATIKRDIESETSAICAKSLKLAEDMAADLRIRREAARHRTEERSRVRQDLERAKAQAADTERRIANNRKLLTDAEAIRAAVTETEQLRAKLQSLELEVVRLDGEVRSHGAEAARHDAERKRQQATASESERRISVAEKTFARRQEVDEAAAQLKESQSWVEVYGGVVKEAEHDLEVLRSRRIAGAEERIAGLRSGLEEILDPLSHPSKVARDTLDTDDGLVRTAEELPTHILEAERHLAGCIQEMRQTEERARNLVELAALVPVIRAADAELAAARAARDAALESAAEAERQAAAAEEASKASGKALRATQTAIDTARPRITELSNLAAKSAPLAQAEARIAELEPQLASAKADLDRLTAELESLPEPEPVPSDHDLPRLRRAADDGARRAREAGEELARVTATREQLEPQVGRLRGELAELDNRVAATPEPTPPGAAPEVVALEGEVRRMQIEQSSASAVVGATEQRLAQAKTAAEKTAELEGERTRLELELADWTRLALDLGRDGIQSAEVDSAGPELTELTNDLLHSCHGSRYTVSIETKRATANGKGEVDECRIMVIHTRAGTEKEAREHSGGEKVIIGEAVSLALSMMACRRAGLEGVTLVRDESGAALDPLNARVYVTMLRRAAAVTRADRVLFVSHSREVVEMADGRVEVGVAP